MENISKERFDFVYNKHKESKVVKFLLKYLARDINGEDRWFKMVFVGAAIGLFIWGMLSTIIGLTDCYVFIPTAIFAVLLFSLAVAVLVAATLHEMRRKKIRDELNVTNRELERLEKKFYPERYN